MMSGESFPDSNIESVFCQTQTAETIPQMVNDFVLEYFCKCIQSNLILKKNDLDIFGMDETKLGRLVWFIKLFCDWLYTMKFSATVLDLPE